MRSWTCHVPASQSGVWFLLFQIKASHTAWEDAALVLMPVSNSVLGKGDLQLCALHGCAHKNMECGQCQMPRSITFLIGNANIREIASRWIGAWLGQAWLWFPHSRYLCSWGFLLEGKWGNKQRQPNLHSAKCMLYLKKISRGEVNLKGQWCCSRLKLRKARAFYSCLFL